MNISYLKNSIQKYDIDDQINPLFIKSYNNTLNANSVAKQVEGIFIQILIKSMRKTLPKKGLFNNSQILLYTELYDQNISQILSKKGIGLAKIIEKQIQSTSQINKIDNKKLDFNKLY